MNRLFVLALALIAMAGCTVSPQGATRQLSAAQLAAGACAGADNPACRFVNTPVKLAPQGTRLPGRALTFFPLADRLEFVDGQNRRWTARKGILTDGASIPQIFVPVIGQPTSPEFLNAAAVHDAYCGIGNEGSPEFQSLPWEVVHRMFYDALVVGGTPVPKAQVMFAAVYLGGPRWDDPFRKNTQVSDAAMQAALRQARRFVDKEKPTMERLITYLRWQERRLGISVMAGDNTDPTPIAAEDDGTGNGDGDPYDPYDPYDPEDGTFGGE